MNNAEGQPFTNWVVTIAFYSAMNFIYLKLFPGRFMVGKSIKIQVACTDFNKYFKKYNFNILTKHGLAQEIINQYHHFKGVNYSKLSLFAHKARYDSTITLSQQQANEACNCLPILKSWHNRNYFNRK